MKIDFSKSESGLVPAIIQDAKTKIVLMCGYMNEEALEVTKKTGKVTFFSRSKSRLWTKGETSGNFLMVESMKADCDDDTILIKVKPIGPACHTGADTCWFEKNEEINSIENSLKFLEHLTTVIKKRHLEPNEKSYTSSLFKKGINKIAQKVGEEAVEIVIEAKDNNPELFLGEAADLLFHYMILLEAKGYDLSNVVSVLEKRHS
ncbi:MAG: bifunctional phosphoribosyl-AMP cyclohydrolase/phosphoribosyl-ATP diphosphatase HisIE [Cytophagales bacterium]|nr:MAG: bifunctional phosphoribosyl-AMP cyclohydrolase/phosphoribosyl-ATP diphosphatase HisIE [Cytophagales bacterium]